MPRPPARAVYAAADETYALGGAIEECAFHELVLSDRYLNRRLVLLVETLDHQLAGAIHLHDRGQAVEGELRIEVGLGSGTARACARLWSHAAEHHTSRLRHILRRLHHLAGVAVDFRAVDTAAIDIALLGPDGDGAALDRLPHA